MPRVAGLIAYDGTEFCGFQVQRDAPTVQGALEEALEELTGAKCRVSGAGRTDTGVHARGQVIAVEAPWGHSAEALRQAWNQRLPTSIQVRCLTEAPEGFHPRFSAAERTYRYTMWVPACGRDGERRFPLVDRFAVVLPKRPDLEAMNVAAGRLIGTHDFATFGQAPQGENTVRRIVSLFWERVEESLPVLDPYPLERLVLTVTANAFLRRMVRNLAGSLLAVGLGRWRADELAAALDAKDRSRSAPPLPPNGLVLERVQYAEYPDLFSAQ
ncbi:MAG: tRNA pseudouridine(38-40) synthase TruA [Caldilineaceae bacterium]|nr:tRNA pseudouridine(38-40) synthase TruA [Caldilineaceae bacterium]